MIPVGKGWYFFMADFIMKKYTNDAAGGQSW